MENIIEKFRDLAHLWNSEPASIYIFKLFTTLIASLLSMNLNSWTPPATSQLEPTYDYIIIGGGTSGIVLASSLATSLDKLGITTDKILVLEAGQKAPLTSEIPYLVGNMKGTKYDWNYLTVPQRKSCKGYVEESCHIPRGKLLGGSVMIQPAVYTIGTKRDFNRWMNMENPGWGWNDVLPYFQSFIERVQLRSYDAFLGQHGDKLRKLKDLIIAAANFLNYKQIENDFDILTNKIGYGKLLGTLLQGKINHPGRSFLAGALKSNVKIQVVRKAFVHKVLVDLFSKRAVQVQYTFENDRGNIQFVGVNKEVILCTGAINNAKLLMLSGIGPSEHLEKMYIETVQDLPGVGKNLQDHVQFPGIFHVINNPNWPVDFEEVEAVEQYILRREGPLTSIGLNNMVGYMHASSAERSDFPNIQINHYYIQKNSINSGFFHNFNFIRDIKEYLRHHNKNNSILLQIPTLIKPKSSGDVQLRDSDPFSPPVIDPGYFTDPDDFDSIMRATKHAVSMGNSPPMQLVNATLLRLDKELCKNWTECSYQWSCVIPILSTSAGHPVGTTRMGKCPYCNNAVVDARLKVHGVIGLRVADASVMPEIVSGDIYASNIMIAQRAAEFIIQDRWEFCERDTNVSLTDSKKKGIFSMITNVLRQLE